MNETGRRMGPQNDGRKWTFDRKWVGVSDGRLWLPTDLFVRWPCEIIYASTSPADDMRRTLGLGEAYTFTHSHV